MISLAVLDGLFKVIYFKHDRVREGLPRLLTHKNGVL